jgi:1-acyl-sn-glycerol-3-phosphate acyltransferase
MRILLNAATMYHMIGREALIDAIMTFLAGHDPALLARARAAVTAEVDVAGSAALASLNASLEATGADWAYYPRDPLARRLHHVLADALLDGGSRVEGLEHVRAVAGRPVVVFANHLSYSDANLIEVLLHRAGASELTDRLTVTAGPKVYSSAKRRFSSLCFGTIKTAQSSGRASEEAVMNPRDVARAARQSINVALDRLAQGDALLVFAEGTRSRTRDMQQMLAGAARYLECPGAWILPVGLTGTEAMFPIGEDALHDVGIVARAGRPIEAARLRAQAGGDRRAMMDAVGHAIAEVLPPEYRGVYRRQPVN